MTFGRMQVQRGMRVVGTDGGPVGEVADTTGEQFVVSRGTPGDLITVPYTAIRALLGDEVVLDASGEGLGEPS